MDELKVLPSSSPITGGPTSGSVAVQGVEELLP